MNEEVVYYWDIHNKILSEKRRRNVILGYILSIVMLVAYSLIFIPAFLNPLKYKIFILIWTCTLLVGGGGLWHIFVRDEIYALRNGIKLTSKELKVYDSKYNLSSILYSEAIDFVRSGGLWGSDRFMALVYCRKGKQGITLIREDETEDILKLSNLIRKLKGISEQKEIKGYGSYIEYYRWKKDVMKKSKEESEGKEP